MSTTLTVPGLESLLSKLGLAVPIPQFNDAHVLEKPVDIYRSYLAEIFARLTNADPSLVYDSLQWTQGHAKGDLVLVIPRLRLKNIRPDEFAEELAAKVPKSVLVEQPSAKGIHLPLFFSPNTLSCLLLPYVFDRASTYGHNQSFGLKGSPDAGRKKVVVEFSSPNIAKEFHAGHLRSTIIGAFISNLYKSMGWDVVKVNYLGDWGKQFGLLAVGWKRFGSEELFQRDPLGHLLDVYVRINALFKPEKAASQKAKEEGGDPAEIESKGIFAERNEFFRLMEERDPEALSLWKRFRDVSIERYVSTYARLNITFDEYSGESTVQPETVQKVESILKEKGIYEEDQGSWIINFKAHGAKNLDIAVVRNRTGTTTYLLRDVAAILERAEKYSFNKMVYVVAAEQDLYFRRVFKTIELMGFPDIAAKLQHINFGKVQGMSSRLGNVTLLSDILDECGSAMHEVMRANAAKYAQVEDPDAVADTLGMTAVMVQDMSGKRINNYPFDIARMTSFEGDTGPYLQYAHARLCSILRKAGYRPEELAKADFSLLKEQHSVDLLRLMAQYPDVTHNAMKTVEPSTILTYLFRLTHQLSSGYDHVKVMGATKDVSQARAALYNAARQVLANGMRLLGFTPVERYTPFSSGFLVEGFRLTRGL
ncbi:MAG: hypothetical protein M1819_005104 [Sarea resinae]|nr:MAG: hypothetical protein M1819_005104 [Sarea resinae]